jgi:hypothetical protein
VSERRLLLWTRLLVGAGLMYQGVAHIQEMRAWADLFTTHAGWQSWPGLGAWRPLELVLWVAFAEFFLGVFLFGGLLTRMLGVAAAVIAGLQVVALGADGGVLAPLLAVGAALVAIRGGGVGTMDSTLGKMQRRSLEREAERRGQRSGVGGQETGASSTSP